MVEMVFPLRLADAMCFHNCHPETFGKTKLSKGLCFFRIKPIRAYARSSEFHLVRELVEVILSNSWCHLLCFHCFHCFHCFIRGLIRIKTTSDVLDRNDYAMGEGP